MIGNPRRWSRYAFALLFILYTGLVQVQAGVAAEQGLDTQSEYTQQDCLDCHNADEGQSPESSLVISLDQYQHSVHGKSLTCRSCHTDIIDDSHMEAEGGGSGAASCIKCHKIKTQSCGLLSGFRIASHGKADLAGRYDTDNCLGCHQGSGAHGETDPLTADNCYLCHSPDLATPMWGKIHPDDSGFSAGWAYAGFAVFFIAVLVRFPAPGRFFTNVNDNRKK